MIMRPLPHLLCLLLLAGLAGCAPTPVSPPNIVLIISDDHGWTDYGFMGHPDIQTPHLDALAAESRVYTRGYVPTSVCRPSLATMITGLFPHEHGITGNDPPGGSETMRYPVARAMMVEVFKRNPTVSQLLADRGFACHQSGKWWEGRPQDHGFSAAMTHGDVARGGRHGDEGLTIGREGLQPITDFLDAVDGQPFFLWYAPFLPHTPHNPPDRLLDHYLAEDRPVEVARYYAMVEWFDETIGELLAQINARGLRENTLVLYVSDNGWIQESGGRTMADSRSKMSPFDAGMRTPIMLRWPGRVEPGRDETTLAGSIDLAPTMLEAAGIVPPAGMPGLSLLHPDRLARRKALYGALFAHTAADLHDPIANLKYRYTVREDGWKLVLPYAQNQDLTLMIDGARADWMGTEPALYNVLADPLETTDQAGARPDLVDELMRSLDDWWTVYQ